MKKVDDYLYAHPKTLTALAVISFLGGVSLGIYHSLKHREKERQKNEEDQI